MFTALIKHEARLQTRPLLLASAACLAVFATGILFALLRLPFFATLGVLLAFGAGAAIMFVLPLYLLWRYAQSMYGREGYLTQALPVRPATLYAAKVTWAFVVWLLATVVGCLMWLGAALAQHITLGGSVSEFVASMREQLGNVPPGTLAWLVVWVLLGLLIYVLQFAWIITFGMEERFRSLGWGGPAVVWFVSYLAVQLLLVVGMFLVPLGLTYDFAWTFESLLPRVTAMFNNQDPGIIPMGWFPVLVATIPVYVVWTLRSLERHTSLR